MTVVLTSFGSDLRAVVVGATGGIGAALTEALAAAPAVAAVLACSRSGDPPDRLRSHAKVLTQSLDLLDEAAIAATAETVRARFGAVGLVLVATGRLHDQAGLKPEKTWRALDPDQMDRAFRVNTIGPAILAKHLLGLLSRDRKAVFAALSARVGSIGDNRLGGWHSYRASKAALNQVLRTCAVELARRNPTALCVGLHPGTVDTPLSAPFQGYVAEEKLFTPAFSAERLLTVLDGLTPADSGGVFAWDGARVPE